MKRILRTTLVAAAFLMLGSFNSFAQKLGYIDSGELIQAMPEIQTVQTKLEAVEKDIMETIETMSVEYNTKLDDYIKTSETLSDAVKQVKEEELGTLSQRIQQFRENASQNYMDEQRKLMEPVVERAREAINKVSKSNGFTVVFDVAAGALAFYDESSMTDVLPLVKTELGIN